MDRSKLKKHPGKGFKAFIGQREKRCNKCGFATFSLHVLYNHRHKCRGQLLGHPVVCSYCRRKFNFLSLYKTHMTICVKKTLRQKFLKNKLKEKHLGYKAKQTELSFSCPICEASFGSKQKFVSHLKKQSCKSTEIVIKPSFSARKSLSKRKSLNLNASYEEPGESSVSWPEKHSFSIHDDELFHCKWCKSFYPSKRLLHMHLKMNFECAKALYRSGSPKRHSLTARKTLSTVAKKSFGSKKQKMVKRQVFNHKRTSMSARKSLPSSRRKARTYDKSSHSDSNSKTSLHNNSSHSDSDSKSSLHHNSSRPDSNSKTSLYQCPVCFKDFTDMFNFFQHQKKMNHWGKATKTMSSTSKCPFCNKEFMHISSRNAHVQNHRDVSKDKIKEFLKKYICGICSQTFVSVQAKEQHVRILHPGRNALKYSGSGLNTPTDSDFASKHKMSSVPKSVKKKLKQQPNTCPVCSKAFSHTVLRNKHFNEAHLKIFECQFCNTKFKSISSLNNHIKLSHSDDFECRECKIKFKDELQLLRHVLKSHPNKDPKLFLPVKLQGSSTKEKEQEKVSEVTASSNERLNYNSQAGNMEYYCDVCNIGYMKLCGLQRHRQSKLHKDTLEKNLDAVQKSLMDLPPSPILNPRKVNKQPEILTCSECSEEFTSIKDFVPHRLSHFSVQGKYLRITELNPYMCEICSEVLDSHSKVQLHLFWHLQVESTSSSSINNGSSKKETIVPDRLSGQHVAKKSFSKQGSESLQEVVIGGVAKPLFTCEACNVGFTTKEHYSMHVRRLCKKGKAANALSNNIDTGRVKDNKKTVFGRNGVGHCMKCNFLFSSSAKVEQHKPYCLKMDFDSSSEENLNNLDAVASALARDIAVAGCVTCGAIFDTAVNIVHLSFHKDYNSDTSISDDVPEDVLHCALCNCLFPLSAFKAHKDFCKIPIHIGDKTSNSKHINVLKSALELKCALAGCISCGEPFDDLDTFVKHLTLHQTNEIQNKSQDINICNGEDTLLSAMDTENENISAENPLEFLNSELAENSSQSDDQEHISSNSLNSSGNSVTKIETSFAEDDHHTPGDIEDLRKNFSQLLCLLISDSELMQTLGYGTLSVDRVLTNVLEQMGQEPCDIQKISPAERFRKNIQNLLNLCLKDQIMQAIGKDKTTDEIVIEALNIFDSEENVQDSDDYLPV